MEAKRKQGEEEAWFKAEPEKVVEVNATEKAVLGAKAEPWFKPKIGTVIPKKKRLVKRRMLDFLVLPFASLCFSSGNPLSNTSTCLKNPVSRKFKGIVPYPA